jgi:hypothetical protein
MQYAVIQYRDHAHPEIQKPRFKKDFESTIIGVCGPFNDKAAAEDHVRWLSNTWVGERYMIMPMTGGAQQMHAVAGMR